MSENVHYSPVLDSHSFIKAKMNCIKSKLWALVEGTGNGQGGIVAHMHQQEHQIGSTGAFALHQRYWHLAQ